jgi:hypothetical protein
MACQARVLGPECKIGEQVFHETKECGKPPQTKFPIDDGDARAFLCSDCVKRWVRKKSPVNTWYGFYDCDYPPTAPVKYAPLWYAALAQEKAQAQAAAQAEKDALAVAELEKKIEEIVNRIKECSIAKDQKGAIAAAKEEARLRQTLRALK